MVTGVRFALIVLRLMGPASHFCSIPAVMETGLEPAESANETDSETISSSTVTEAGFAPATFGL